MTERTFGLRTCTECPVEFEATSPNQKTCSADCSRRRNRERRRAKTAAGPPGAAPGRGAANRGPMPPAFAAALTATVLRLREARHPPTLTLPGLGQLVRHLVAAHRDKDRDGYADALAALAGWALSELTRVRADDEPTA